MERVAPAALNYDNILPLAIESRSNRREFRPNNGATFSNATGATHIRIDVNADSMLDPLNSYLEVNLNNTGAAGNFLGLAPFGPAFIQRLRIESGGVVIEDIDEYSRLYAMTSLCQCPKDYLSKNYNAMGMYQKLATSNLRGANNNGAERRFTNDDCAGSCDTNAQVANPMTLSAELEYPPSLQSKIGGFDAGATVAGGAPNRPTGSGLNQHCKTSGNVPQKMCIPLLSGFLNMDKYIPLIMMNAGFTLDIEIVSDEKVGVATTEAAGAESALAAATYSISDVKYVAHLIDLDRGFYDRLRAVMEGSGGVLQLAGQTYRHYVGQIDAGIGPHTITLPARVKSVKSIFATFHDNATYGTNAGGYSQSVFQNALLSQFRFEIGSVRYPQNDIQCRMTGTDRGNTAGIADVIRTEDTEFLVELQKAFGKLGDYAHQLAFDRKNLMNVDRPMTGGAAGVYDGTVISSYILGYDFEAFQRVALEAGINTADRSLPINFICSRYQALPAVGGVAQQTRADFYVLTDAIYYINLDGTVSVSV